VEAALAAGCTRFVNTGTYWQHCNSAGYEPVDLYAATKQAFEDLLLYYHRVRGLSCVTLKLYDNYGPEDPRRKIVNLLIDSCLGGAPLDLSPGEQILDLTHIEDVTDAFMATADFVGAAPAPIWDIGFVSGERMRLKDLVAAVQAACGSPAPSPIALGKRPYRTREIMEPVAGPAGAALAGWTPRRRLAESLPSLIACRAGRA
jgi:nucleoside-diphosphate-sugar epimerase